MVDNKFYLKLFKNTLYNNIISTKGEFFNIKTRVDHRDIFYNLKTNYDYDEKCYIADNIPFRFEKYIFGNPFPKKIEELGNGVYIHHSDSIFDEINWVLLSIRKYSDYISKFLKLKSQYDKFILLGEYFRAESILDQIENEISVSIWGIENKLLIKELQGGVDSNKIYLSQVNEIKNNHFIAILADFFSKKAENDFLFNRYNTEVKNIFDKSSKVLDKKSIEYYYFKINYYEYKDYENLNFINSVEFQNSLIDRYLTLIKILQNLIFDQSLNESDLKRLKSRILYLNEKITDPILDNIKLIFQIENSNPLSEFDKKYISILDDYTKGNYEYVIQNAKKLIYNYPQLFEMYIIYCKSLINTRSNHSAIGNINNLQNKLINEIYSLLLKESNPLNHALNLRKISSQISTLQISSQIIDFAMSESANIYKFNKQALLNTYQLNPLFHEIYQNSEKAEIYLNILSNLFGGKSNTIHFFKYKLKNDLSNNIARLSVSTERTQFYNALACQEKKDYESAIKLWISLLCDSSIKPHTLIRIISNLYYCYNETNNTDAAIGLFVNNFFTNPFFTQKLDTKIVLERVRKGRFKGVNINIDVPLFFSIAGAEDTKVSAACECFFKINNVNKPSEFIDKIQKNPFNCEKEKLIYFFDKVCTIDLFKHIVSIKTTKDKLNERLEIIDFLVNFDVQNQTKYLEEKEDINRQIFIQEGLQEYDESKIFINEKMIRTTLLNDLEAEFQRFRSISRIGRNLIVYDYMTESVRSLSLKSGASNLDEPIFSSNPLIDIFKNIFLEVRSYFLDSQYGLGEYLSARIRHGVFKSEIRPKFEKLKLITEKDANTNIYKRNMYWDDRMIAYDENIRNKLQEYLYEFSATIDNLIEDEALKKYLQIKIEGRNEDGWFDYLFSNVDFSYFYTCLKTESTFSGFIDGIFVFLWQRTDINLENIRNKLNFEYKEKFEEAITVLEKNISKILNKYYFPEIFENIATSKVNIQNDLDRIARWFNRIGQQTKEFPIDKIVEISVEHINKRYDEKDIKLIRNINCNLIFKGELLPSFIDLMCGFFDNSIKYCGLDKGSLDVGITIDLLNNDSLYIKIDNPLSGDIDIKVEELKDFKIHLAKSSTEGKSGLKKATRTLVSDFGDRNNKLDFYIDEFNKKFVVECLINTSKLQHEDINS